MDGIAPIGGSQATNAAPVQGAGTAVPGAITPAPPPPPKPAETPSFTAFPSSYAGFGTNGTAFGTLGVVNGKLSILSPPDDAAPADAAKAPPAATQPTAAAPQTAPKPPPPPPAEVTNASAGTNGQTPNPSTAIQPQDVPSLQKTGADDEKTANESGTLDHAANNGNNATPLAGSNPPPAPASPPPPAPTGGLLGAPSGPPPLPGGTAVENDPALGLLGAPATNPIFIQAQQQEENAAQETAAAASAAAAAQATARQQLAQVDFRIAAARADNNTAAVAQLQPTVTKLTGEIQGQTFAGVGTTPPQPFARPEIPTVFLNIAS